GTPLSEEFDVAQSNQARISFTCSSSERAGNRKPFLTRFATGGLFRMTAALRNSDMRCLMLPRMRALTLISGLNVTMFGSLTRSDLMPRRNSVDAACNFLNSVEPQFGCEGTARYGHRRSRQSKYLDNTTLCLTHIQLRAVRIAHLVADCFECA